MFLQDCILDERDEKPQAADNLQKLMQTQKNTYI